MPGFGHVSRKAGQGYHRGIPLTKNGGQNSAQDANYSPSLRSASTAATCGVLPTQSPSRL
jgi:hypothetical protein